MRNSINNITQFYNNNFSLSTKRVHVFLINFDLFNSDDFKEFLSNEGWVTIKADNPYIEGYYFNMNKSGSVSGDHFF